MTPPEAPQDGTASPGDNPPAVSVRLHTLKKRPDFIALSRARRQATGAMIVQARRRAPGVAEGIRVGYTCSKKVGNAVLRNRAKRRLRAAARAVLPALGQDGWDYVLIGRRDQTAHCPFDRLVSDLTYAVTKLHRPPK
ncbi:ribonuclease P protein component [Seohaeicola saemankumensis]|nr:ribonuclease P protein component [Seohaeicola saemankumensis]MCA0872956.1 ribonuclease P protein component [Seohaeicola saemankumensis]